MKREFEEWYRDKYQVTKQLYFFEDTQRYEDGFAQDAWEVWQHRQTKVDELNQELHLVLNNWNDLTNAIHARTNGTAVAEARQLYEKVDELQRRNQMLTDSIKEQGQKLVYQNEVIETQAEKLLCLRDE